MLREKVPREFVAEDIRGEVPREFVAENRRELENYFAVSFKSNFQKSALANQILF